MRRGLSRSRRANDDRRLAIPLPVEREVVALEADDDLARLRGRRGGPDVPVGDHDAVDADREDGGDDDGGDRCDLT
jgi:hypothetical protein